MDFLVGVEKTRSALCEVTLSSIIQVGKGRSVIWYALKLFIGSSISCWDNIVCSPYLEDEMERSAVLFSHYELAWFKGVRRP